MPDDLDGVPAFGNEGRARISDRLTGLAIAPDRSLEVRPIGADQPQPLLCLADIDDEGSPFRRVDHCRDGKVLDKFRLLRRIEQLGCFMDDR